MHSQYALYLIRSVFIFSISYIAGFSWPFHGICDAIIDAIDKSTWRNYLWFFKAKEESCSWLVVEAAEICVPN